MKRKVFINLISEISHYILDADPSRMVISLHQEDDGLHLAVLDDVHRNDEELEAIRASLKNPDRPELAGYYGSLAGFDVLGSARLDIIGWQVKAASVSHTDSGTKIDLWMGGDRFNPDKFTLSEKTEK